MQVCAPKWGTLRIKLSVHGWLYRTDGYAMRRSHSTLTRTERRRLPGSKRVVSCQPGGRSYTGLISCIGARTVPLGEVRRLLLHLTLLRRRAKRGSRSGVHAASACARTGDRLRELRRTCTHDVYASDVVYINLFANPGRHVGGVALLRRPGWRNTYKLPRATSVSLQYVGYPDVMIESH